MSGISRRKLLGTAGVVGAAGVVGGAGVAMATRSDETQITNKIVKFRGLHQAGIATPVQDRLHFVAFDLVSTKPAAIRTLLRQWSTAIEEMTQGLVVGPGGALNTGDNSPPDDTGEALGLPAARLTVTIGFGPDFFRKLKLKDLHPAALADLPHFAGDNLKTEFSGGDICVQACADDPQVAVHAIRNLARIGFGTVGVRYSQLGFGKTASTTPEAQTPRNLFGFKDGTNNISGTDDKTLNDHVWVAPGDGPAWMTGGSYLVSRRIRMLIESWDRTALAEQEAIIGRDKGEGAAYGQRKERDAFNPRDLPDDSHVRLAHPDVSKVHILRRGYSFVDGSDGLGRLDAGLFFLAYQRDPRKQFVKLQNDLSRLDTLNEYIQHVGSGVWAIPPGLHLGSKDYLGHTLLES